MGSDIDHDLDPASGRGPPFKPLLHGTCLGGSTRIVDCADHCTARAAEDPYTSSEGFLNSGVLYWSTQKIMIQVWSKRTALEQTKDL